LFVALFTTKLAAALRMASLLEQAGIKSHQTGPAQTVEQARIALK